MTEYFYAAMGSDMPGFLLGLYCTIGVTITWNLAIIVEEHGCLYFNRIIYTTHVHFIPTYLLVMNPFAYRCSNKC